jgi:hypothetical protein
MFSKRGRSIVTLLLPAALAIVLSAGQALAQCSGGGARSGARGRPAQMNRVPQQNSLLSTLRQQGALPDQLALLTALQQQVAALGDLASLTALQQQAAALAALRQQNSQQPSSQALLLTGQQANSSGKHKSKRSRAKVSRHATVTASSSPSPADKEQANVTALAGRLAADVAAASGNRRAELIQLLQETKGVPYTQALVQAIAGLDGQSRAQARDALTERLTRMTARTLRRYLAADDRELRSAAALAAAMKEDTGFIADLIGLLRDRDARVVQAARVALGSLTGQDFGPSASGSQEAVSAAVHDWQAWWQRQHGG